jgi:hypothetical protein
MKQLEAIELMVGDWVVYNRNDHSREVIQIYDIRDVMTIDDATKFAVEIADALVKKLKGE